MTPAKNEYSARRPFVGGRGIADARASRVGKGRGKAGQSFVFQPLCVRAGGTAGKGPRRDPRFGNSFRLRFRRRVAEREGERGRCAMGKTMRLGSFRKKVPRRTCIKRKRWDAKTAWTPSNRLANVATG